jgi:RNA ligase (TIGR02306 family)
MRKLASIQKILAVDPIEGADAIVRVKVLGWECVALKDEFSVGDNCVYFEIDSLLPVAPWTDFLRKGDERPFRLKTVKLRGVTSQGLALPFSHFKKYGYNISEENGEFFISD